MYICSWVGLLCTPDIRHDVNSNSQARRCMGAHGDARTRVHSPKLQVGGYVHTAQHFCGLAAQGQQARPLAQGCCHLIHYSARCTCIDPRRAKWGETGWQHEVLVQIARA